MVNINMSNILDEFIKKSWKENPFIYVYEADVRSELYVIMKNKIINEEMQLVVKKAPAQDSFNDQKTISIHCESTVAHNHYQHLDIGIWDKERSEGVKKDDYKDFPTRIGIEIKYYYTKQPSSIVCQKITEALNKLINIANENLEFIFNGYTLVFVPRVDDKNNFINILRKYVKENDHVKELKNNKSKLELWCIFKDSKELVHNM